MPIDVERCGHGLYPLVRFYLQQATTNFDIFAILDRFPHLLGIGIDEGTAIEVSGNEFHVLGAGYVAIYGGTFLSCEGSLLKQLPETNRPFYFLRHGDRYDLAERRVIR